MTPHDRSAQGRQLERGAHLRLLGGFHLRCRGRQVAPPTTAQRLLALLALRERPVSRAYVAGELWLDSSEQHATGSLRSALWRLRRTDPELVQADNGRLALGRSVTVDVHTMVDTSRGLRRDAPIGDVDERLFADELLPDWYDDWVVLERERLRQVRLEALEALAARLIAVGDHGGAVRAALTAVRCECLRESSHRLLVRAHTEAGNYWEAIRQYRLFADLLDREMGLTPSPMMMDLVAPLLAVDDLVTARLRTVVR